MAKNILLTGATGFIGSHVLQGLLQKDYNVIVLMRPTSNTWRIDSLKNEFTSVIVTSSAIDFEPLFEQYAIETVIHLATNYGRQSHLSDLLISNVVFPVRLLEAGLKTGLKRFINTDSFSGKNPETSFYLQHYIHTKNILLSILQEESAFIRIDSLRLEHPFGENDSEGKFVSMLINEMKQQKEKIALTDGLQKRDFIYVKDVVSAFIKVLEQDDNAIGFTEYEVGTGHSISVKEFVKSLATVMKSDTTLAFGELPSRKNELRDSKADTTLLKDLGWFPVFDLKSGLLHTVASIIDKGEK